MSESNCTKTVTACVEAATPVSLEVTPRMTETHIECGTPRICDWSESRYCRKNRCEFTVKQTIIVEIPISYDVKVDTHE